MHMYIIRLKSTFHPRYLKRIAGGKENIWVVRAEDGTRYNTQEEAANIISTFLKGFLCDVIEWEPQGIE